MPHGNIALQDFIAGQEASIKQYGLDSAAAGQGLQVQMQVQEGSARVQALIQQEVDLVKQELLSARLRSPATLNATGGLLLLLLKHAVDEHFIAFCCAVSPNQELNLTACIAKCCFCGSLAAESVLLISD